LKFLVTALCPEPQPVSAVAIINNAVIFFKVVAMAKGYLYAVNILKNKPRLMGVNWVAKYWYYCSLSKGLFPDDI
jgi:hypothetical protein